MTRHPPAKRGAEQVVDVIPLLTRHKTEVLLDAGLSRKAVAAQAQVSLATVRRVKLEADVVDVDDGARRKAVRVGRPSKVSAFDERVRSWLEAEPELPTQELLRRASLSDFLCNLTRST